MGRKAIDLKGKTFGRLEVLERAGTAYTPNFTAVPLWRCRCECGKIVVVRGVSLRNESTRSCGCLQAELAKERFTKNNPKGERRLKHGAENYSEGPGGWRSA